MKTWNWNNSIRSQVVRISKVVIYSGSIALLLLIAGQADQFSQLAFAGADATCHFHGKKVQGRNLFHTEKQ